MRQKLAVASVGRARDDERKRETLMKWLFVAYAIVWLAVFFYLFDLARKQNAISREIEGLKAKLGLGEKTARG